MQEYKENDSVYTQYGYGVILKTPIKKELSSSNQESPEKERKDLSLKVPEGEGVICNGGLAEPKIYSIQLKWGGISYIEEKHLKKKITIFIKTFFGNKTTVKVEADLTMTIQQLKNHILESAVENAKTVYNLRIIYPMGTLQELSQANSSLEQYNVSDQAHLVLLAQTSFHWDPNCKGSAIQTSNNDLTITKSADADFQSILGNIQLSGGRHYWEIRIDHFTDEEDLFIGIARKNLDLYARPMDTKVFWGYMCLCAKKFGPDGLMVDYGYQAKKNDVIGVLLEFKSQIASLSFYRNGVKCGVAFNNLTGSFCPAVCINYGEAQVTLDPKAQMPLS